MKSLRRGQPVRSFHFLDLDREAAQGSTAGSAVHMRRRLWRAFISQQLFSDHCGQPIKSKAAFASSFVAYLPKCLNLPGWVEASSVPFTTSALLSRNVEDDVKLWATHRVQSCFRLTHRSVLA